MSDLNFDNKLMQGNTEKGKEDYINNEEPSKDQALKTQSTPDEIFETSKTEKLEWSENKTVSDISFHNKETEKTSDIFKDDNEVNTNNKEKNTSTHSDLRLDGSLENKQSLNESAMDYASDSVGLASPSGIFIEEGANSKVPYLPKEQTDLNHAGLWISSGLTAEQLANNKTNRGTENTPTYQKEPINHNFSRYLLHGTAAGLTILFVSVMMQNNSQSDHQNLSKSGLSFQSKQILLNVQQNTTSLHQKIKEKIKQRRTTSTEKTTNEKNENLKEKVIATKENIDISE